MVDDRRYAILRAVVQQYIETSQPVSSSHITEMGHVTASSATVRSEMAALERDGYLHQPHTSAGRVPTDRGYRFFVDQIDQSKLDPGRQQDVRQFFAKATGEIEQMMTKTGSLLSQLTGVTALVVGPEHETKAIRSFQLVSLNPNTSVAVVVFSNGAVDKWTVDFKEPATETVINAASVRIASYVQDKSVTGVAAIPASGNRDIDAVVDKTIEALKKATSETSESVYVGGASHVAESFEAVETVRNVLTILEQQYVVVSLIRDLLDRGMTVSIGEENNLQPLAECSLVVAPTIIDGEHRGSVAVIGPTRMDYARAMAAVSVVSRRLGDHLSSNQK